MHCMEINISAWHCWVFLTEQVYLISEESGDHAYVEQSWTYETGMYIDFYLDFWKCENVPWYTPKLQAKGSGRGLVVRVLVSGL